MKYKKYFTLSYDDGVEHDKRIITLMKKYGLKGTFNLNAGLLGKRSKLNKRIARIPADELKQVYESFEVASHGYKHEMYKYLSNKKTQETISKDIQVLSDIIGYRVSGHAYPYAMYTKKAEEALRKENVVYARHALGKGSFKFPENTLKYMPTCWINTKEVFRLIDEFVQAKPEQEDMLFMMWGHSYELEFGVRKCPEDQVERIFEKISGHKDIVYCTNREAFSC